MRKDTPYTVLYSTVVGVGDRGSQDGKKGHVGLETY